ncbi:4Fe-4S dicluster domain-containing protein [Syntrophobacter fumaroxidans]|uniref:4Fe-4S ferredoxin, iron-sulfur binding domain protein n=1 Tax=Syntrophobacter fumaroxidans (strain DSM 10017 / MPOB) TaxID=335543 RepID=A0LJQ4_SYNFM|nr:4Fe-4S dicluster domain-containing protein [Syntrophobacter fumaroxidans]ABK17656.1 4Fe-4S ferredoxin, iron-sulfur binding domain protein [Syntrophobacter fumaroxidans MPOB]
MQAYTEKIREAAKRLLSEQRVDVVIGFRKGTVPFMNEPFLAKSPDQADQLYWDGNCGINLANYLPKRTDRIAIVAKGCDTRSIVVQLLEYQIRREQLYILGAPCHGMIDRRRIADELNGREPSLVEESDSGIRITGRDLDLTLERGSFLQENCAICIHRNPVIYDELLGEPVAEQQNVDRYEDVKAVEAMGAQERWEYFEDLIAPCIRCYACRNACPACYCPTCFVDEARPQWVGKSTDPTDTRTFHFLRAYHLAGRCTDCGACERACPVGIKVRQFTKKLEKDVKELYGYEVGLSLDERPSLDTYRPGDPESFIK